MFTQIKYWYQGNGWTTGRVGTGRMPMEQQDNIINSFRIAPRHNSPSSPANKQPRGQIKQVESSPSLHHHSQIIALLRGPVGIWWWIREQIERMQSRTLLVYYPVILKPEEKELTRKNISPSLTKMFFIWREVDI